MISNMCHFKNCFYGVDEADLPMEFAFDLMYYEKTGGGCGDETLSSGDFCGCGLCAGADHAGGVAEVGANIYCQLIRLIV